MLHTRMIHPCSPWIATSARGKVCGRGACWTGGKRTHWMLVRGAEPMLAERGQLMQGVVSHLGDRDAHLLALRPTIDSLLPDPPVRNRFRWERLAQRLRLEAYPLPARSDCCTSDCVGGGKGTKRLVCACVGGTANERKGRSSKCLKLNPKHRWSRLYLSPSRPSRPTLLYLSGHSAQQSTHAAADTQMCANGRGLHEGSP